MHGTSPTSSGHRRRPPGRTILATAATLAGFAACTPPEAARVQGGGPGGDPLNHATVIDMHGGSNIYYGTPCVNTLDRCTGPLPLAGTPRRDRLLQQWND